jgi:hypothetical protein
VRRHLPEPRRKRSPVDGYALHIMRPDQLPEHHAPEGERTMNYKSPITRPAFWVAYVAGFVGTFALIIGAAILKGVLA